MLIGADVRAPVLAENDINDGSPVFVTQAGARLRHNCFAARPGSVDAARYDYRLLRASPCRRAGRRPAPPRASRFQYAGAAGHVGRIDGGVVAGAFGVATP